VSGINARRHRNGICYADVRRLISNCGNTDKVRVSTGFYEINNRQRKVPPRYSTLSKRLIRKVRACYAGPGTSGRLLCDMRRMGLRRFLTPFTKSDWAFAGNANCAI
jgi:hypothetical protein